MRVGRRVFGVEEGPAEGKDDQDEDVERNEPVPTWQRPIKVLTNSDLDTDEPMSTSTPTRRWTIYDVILPLPGSSIDLPPGWMSELYNSILAADGLTHAQLISSKIPEYQLKGSYRRMLVKPRNFDYRITSYTDPDIPRIPMKNCVSTLRFPTPSRKRREKRRWEKREALQR